MYFIDVILPIPIKQAFTYAVNVHEAHFLKPGHRVAVPFGKSKIYTGIVYRVHQTPPQMYETKEIDQILDEHPLVTQTQLRHWQWIADYYLCSMGEVMRAALPGAFLLESETIIRLQTERPYTEATLSTQEELILEALENRQQLHLNDVRNLLEKKQVLGVIQALIDKNRVALVETLYEQYIPKMVSYLQLAPEYQEEAVLTALLDEMQRAPKQKEVLMQLFMLSARQSGAVKRQELLSALSGGVAPLKALIDKGIVIQEKKQTDRKALWEQETAASKGLSEAQQKALDEIRTAFSSKSVCLFHGVTSSGKTEVYVKLIEEMLDAGKQVLYMLPEIALTTQLISRLQYYFGDRVGVYHSRYSVHERVEVWNQVLRQDAKAQLVIGARSTVFLPFQDLGLIIVDEEHEHSFKQYSPAPRYHGRDSAIVLGALSEAKVLLGSATPALESYHNASTGKYGLVSLKERFGKVLLPDTQLVDLRDKNRKKRMQGHFSDTLLEAIKETLSENKQVILFKNRRGFAPIMECMTCGSAPQCPNCDVSLTYHKAKGQLRCHYCGYATPITKQCGACGSMTLDPKGFGTEQIQNELQELLPEARISRMDQDTTKGKHAHAKLIHAFEQGEIDVLVGTQMLAKGLDFRAVGLVGVMQADTLLNFPDFRAHERSFQLLSQVAGRAGRTKDRGKVLIQAYNPEHMILQQVTTHDFDGMFKDEMEQRRHYGYPPFNRLIRFTFKHRNFESMQNGARWFAKALEAQFNDGVLGPEIPPVGRIRNEYLSHVLLKVPIQAGIKAYKGKVGQLVRNFEAQKPFARIKLIVDVDPY
ncbi:primosomal protein N' [Gilvibacter sp.]|uniref:replication restart helicase PriA n=1 Tax=Gilvibacter sp. TaxID=2729997 RepID=UPI0025C251EE|nr:primosomal protein N' [Gilvibacter sp.]NQX77617.1 primosomal protein N' [Gilvibacter sp.]